MNIHALAKMQRFWPVLLAILLALAAAVAGQSLAATQDEEKVSPPTLSKFVVRLPVVAGRPAAIYGQIKGGSADDRLLGISVEGAARAELHETVDVDGVMRMRSLRALHIPEGGTVRLRSGDLHAMVFGLPETEVGTAVQVTLRFDKAGEITVGAIARPSVSAGHQHH